MGIDGVGVAIGPEWEPLKVGKVKDVFWEEEEEETGAMDVRESEELMDVISNNSFRMVQRQLYVSNLSILLLLYFFFSMKREEILSWSKCYGPTES